MSVRFKKNKIIKEVLMDTVKTTSQHPFFALLRYMRGERRYYILGTIYSFFNKLFDILPEVLIGAAVDIVVNGNKSLWARLFDLPTREMQLFALGGVTFFVWCLESLFQYLYSIKWRNLAQIAENKMRLDAYTAIQSAPLEKIESVPAGSLIATINDDVNQLERFLEDGLNQMIQIVCSTVLIGIIFFITSPLIACFAILPIPVILVGAFYFQNKLEPRFLDVRSKAANISSILENNLSGLLTIKSYTAEKKEYDHVKELSEAYQKANEQTIQISSLVTPVIRIAVLTGFMCTLLIGGHKTIAGTMNVGAFSVLVFLSQRLLWPFSRLADVFVNYQRAMASTVRVLSLLSWPREPYHKGEILARDYDQVSDITFSRIGFGYHDTALFQDLNVSIPHNKVVAFVGESGSGKSSIIKLLLRFYTPQSGEISYGGHNIHDMDQTMWRKKISFVSQEAFLFFGTVFDNIAYGCNEGSIKEKDIINAAKQAGAHDFIMGLKDGYQTKLGGWGGVSLSGGQKQRIAIARALVNPTPILILDEATSAVDNKTELDIQNALAHLVKGRTVIMVAHRLSTIRHADHIYVMKEGHIVEAGTHEDLLKKEGHYSMLWKIQTGEFLEG